jgi:hypothetical protein
LDADGDSRNIFGAGEWPLAGWRKGDEILTSARRFCVQLAARQVFAAVWSDFISREWFGLSPL